MRGFMTVHPHSANFGMEDSLYDAAHAFCHGGDNLRYFAQRLEEMRKPEHRGNRKTRTDGGLHECVDETSSSSSLP
jgi:hypothetical protein